MRIKTSPRFDRPDGSIRRHERRQRELAIDLDREMIYGLIGESDRSDELCELMDTVVAGDSFGWDEAEFYRELLAHVDADECPEFRELEQIAADLYFDPDEPGDEAADELMSPSGEYVPDGGCFRRKEY